ncbi:MAG: hypothetical protein HGB05_21690, partial [Chloroflexi bacterium]|nr:hypothetical protein [Chloroflexota bacterium]
MKRISKSKQVATLLGASLLMLTACVPDAPTRGGAAQPASIERSSDDGSASNSNAAPSAASNASEAGTQTVTQPAAASAAQSTFASPLPTPTSQPQNEIEFTGTVEVIASDMWVVGGRAVAVTAATEIKPGLTIGTLAKVHAMPQANGSLWAREIEPAADDDGNGNGNSNDNGNGNSNDDNGNGNVNSNDDNG